MDATRQVARSYEISNKVAQLYQKRTKVAQEHFRERLTKAGVDGMAGLALKPVAPTEAWSNWYAYATDFAQRSILFWDTLRERGNNFVEHNRAGIAAGPAFRPRDGRRRQEARPSGQLCAGAHRPAGGRARRSRSGGPT